jgi:thioredoxin-like negative regulator of GroEL
VSAFPTILVVTQDGEHPYEGAVEFDLRLYLAASASSEKKPAKMKQIKDLPKEVQDSFETRSVKAEDFEELLERSQKLVLVHYYKPNVAPSWADITAKYKGVVEIVDCSQHTELAKTHGVKRIPSMRLFPANRNA